MRIVFNNADFEFFKLSAEIIAQEVELVGFSAELLETIIDNTKKLRDDKFNDEEDGSVSNRKDGDKGINVIKNIQLIITGMTCAAC